MIKEMMCTSQAWARQRFVPSGLSSHGAWHTSFSSERSSGSLFLSVSDTTWSTSKTSKLKPAFSAHQKGRKWFAHPFYNEMRTHNWLNLFYFREGSNTSELQAWLAGSGIVLSSFLSVMANHLYFFRATRLGMRFRVAFSSLIYRKAIRLNQSAFETSTTGQMVNLLRWVSRHK